MFIIAVLRPSTVFCDNNDVYKNFCFFKSTLQNKHNYIYLNSVRECVATNIITVHKVEYKLNLSDILTKYLAVPLQMFIQEHIMFITSN